MNRAERRRQKREIRKSNKKNFVPVGYANIPIKQLHFDENLKECDKELVELITKSMDWEIKSPGAKRIINYGISYLDSLCSLRFDTTPVKDRKAVRDTMHIVSDAVNLFIGVRLDGNSDETLNEIMDRAKNNGETAILFNVPQHEELAPIFGDVLELPSEDDVDDIYADCVVRHARELGSTLFNTRCSSIEGDEQKVFEILLFIGKKTVQLLPEAQMD